MTEEMQQALNGERGMLVQSAALIERSTEIVQQTTGAISFKGGDGIAVTGRGMSAVIGAAAPQAKRTRKIYQSFTLQVHAGPNGVSVTPGYVYDTLTPHLYAAPTIGGISIFNKPPPLMPFEPDGALVFLVFGYHIEDGDALWENAVTIESYAYGGSGPLIVRPTSDATYNSTDDVLETVSVSGSGKYYYLLDRYDSSGQSFNLQYGFSSGLYYTAWSEEDAFSAVSDPIPTMFFPF